MPRNRDRHERGLRGPLALPHAWTRRPVPLHRPSRTEYFNQCVTWALEAITDVDPRALDGIIVGVEEVPFLQTAWSGDRVPMSAALEPSRNRSAQIVIYERPLEHRARDRVDLRALVHRTIVEQLSALTARPLSDFVGDDPDWDF